MLCKLSEEKIRSKRLAEVFVVENGRVELAVRRSRVAGDSASLDEAKRPVQVVRGIAVAGVEHEKGPRVGPSHLLDRGHERSPDSLALKRRMNQHLGDLGSVETVGAERAMELYRPDDASVALGDEQVDAWRQYVMPIANRRVAR